MARGDDQDLLARAAGLILDGEADRALSMLGQAFAATPTRTNLLDLMAEAHARLGRLGSVLCCRQAAAAIETSPDNRAKLALALHDCSRLADAKATAQAAIDAAGGELYAAETVLALVAVAEGRHDEAEAAYRRLIDIHPERPQAYGHLGILSWSLGRADQAEAALTRCLELEPGMNVAAAALGLIRLSRGLFADGWSLYRRRHVSARPHPPTRHLPKRLNGQTILVETEQGLGDELFFLRFAAPLAARGARVLVRPSPKLAALAARLTVLDGSVGPDETPKADHHVWLGDLPWLLDADSPLPSLTLAPLPDRVQALQARLAAFSTRPLIGVTWRAGTQMVGRLSKALSPEGVATALAPVEADIVVLQRAPDQGEIERFAAALGRPVLDLSDANEDLEDMLAALSLLERQVAVSNTNLHLAALLGKPANLLLPHPPEFRWMDKGEESPWFPGVRLYRQQGGGTWRPALAALTADLTGQTHQSDRLAAAIALKDQGQLAEAEGECRALLAQAPDDPNALHLLAALMLSDRRPGEAVAPLKRLARLAPSADVWRFLGQALAAVQLPDEAVAPLRKALALAPNHPGLGHLLASVLMEAGRTDEALEQARAVGATAIEGTCLHLLGRSAEAVPLLRKALTVPDANADKSLNSLAQALYALERYDEAEATWAECLKRNPGNHRARGSLAMMLLALGRLAEGWDHYRYRHTALGRPGIPVRPLPERLDGYEVLVVGEQGLGDELFLMRFVERLAARGANLTYVPGPKLAPIAARLPFLARTADGTSKITANIGIWAGDLPWLLAEPGPLPPIELAPLPELVEQARARLAAFGPPPYVGVTWRAGISGFNKLSKDIAPSLLAESLRGQDARIVVLQRSPLKDEIEAFAAALGREVLDCSDANDDLEAMTALLSLLDRQVAVSNTNVHLAASLGRPVEVLVPRPPEFRWLVTGESSPWFPACRVYRQSADGDWAEALGQLSAGLTSP
ncbi:tetratricopeptide repeat protein [Magnetospirillum moscoviense]|uniref:Peptide transporter n=1 Tax=Magnetospirillum moscoviense TaxID=1437059 RepID=A0A178M8U0_9PROT|nr:tetratricopeptide repeat protein [Magnetospirillum moscoviense]OAN44946.1 hypothetical protein A6A05_17235 [Magnetospirillum moscoviense]